MKKLAYIILVLLIFACDSENANNCFQTSGSIVQEEVQLEPFTRILVNRGVELILKQETEYSIIVESGENLIGDVSVSVQGNQLILTDNNTCNYVRDYVSTKIYVSAPNITEIRSSTQYDVSSDGILSFELLNLLSEDFNAPDSFTTGDFRLNVDISELRIVANNLSAQYISGMVNTLNINFAAGSGRFEGENLIAQDVIINHRGSNDMVINPQQSISGQIRGTGDVISLNEPPIVEVERLYTGQLIFQ